MSPAFPPRTARSLRALLHCRRSILAVFLFSLASCVLSSPAKGGEPEFSSVKLAASSALRATAVSGVAPVLVPPSVMRVNPGETADQTLLATDPDGDPLTFSKVSVHRT